jgi:hypothetical protein
MPRSRRSGPIAVEPHGVLVNSIAPVARKCCAAIEKVVASRGLNFHPRPSNQPRSSLLQLSGPGSLRAVARDPYPVVHFLTTGRTQYWLAVSFSLYSPSGSGGTYLTQVSILIFEGPAGDPEKRPLLRAEWYCKGNYRQDRHAQPHWHIYSSLLNRDLTNSTFAFAEVNTAQDFLRQQQEADAEYFEAVSGDVQALGQNELSWPQGESFHFAMSSRWQTSVPNEELKPEDLGNWMDWCLRYISEQLEYVDGG